MAGLDNPTEKVTAIESDEEMLDMLHKILRELRLSNHHLAIVTKSDVKAIDMED